MRRAVRAVTTAWWAGVVLLGGACGPAEPGEELEHEVSVAAAADAVAAAEAAAPEAAAAGAPQAGALDPSAVAPVARCDEDAPCGPLEPRDPTVPACYYTYRWLARFTSVKAIDTTEWGSRDEIYMARGSSTTWGPVNIDEGQTLYDFYSAEYTTTSYSSSSRYGFALWEDDSTSSDDQLGTYWIPQTPGEHTARFTNGGDYEMKINVERLSFQRFCSGTATYCASSCPLDPHS